jgi:acyl dehydratase
MSFPGDTITCSGELVESSSAGTEISMIALIGVNQKGQPVIEGKASFAVVDWAGKR